MIADLKPYAEYKESGLPWLGRVPEHWEVRRAKSVFQRIDERSKTGREELLTVSSARGIVPRKGANVTMFKAESYIGYKLCWPGDLVINSLWAWAGGLGVSKRHGIISSAYGVYRIRPDVPVGSAFAHQVVRSSSFNWELRVRSKGVWISRLQLTDLAFFDAPIHIPPPDEQAAIVRFLDWANGRLERAIRAKRKVIALLNEQKQAIIHRAVTRG
ncbi:MAG: restriction endonuclease subunit S, partial [Candidatus Accumulibacter sp.]|nr:restriction endonuclease subunit S [Accumulibacter sp.]